MMHEMKTVKTWLIAVAVLLALIAGGTAQAQNVTPQQREKLKALALETGRKTQRERDELRRARTELLLAYGNYDLDERKTKAARDRLQKAQLNLLNIYLQNQAEIREVLSSEQFAQFRRIMERTHNPNAAVLPPPEDQLADRIPDKAMLDSLGLSAEQRKRSAQIIGPTPQKTKVIEKLRRDSKQIMDVYSDYRLDTAAARKLISSIHNSQVELLELNHKKQQAMRSILTRSQFNQLQEQIAERMKTLQKKRPPKRR